MTRLSIHEILRGYEEKRFSPVEITKQYIEQAKRSNPTYNAYITITEELALKQAEILEKQLEANSELGRLVGIPISYKDNIHTKDVLTTSGAYIDREYIPNQNAEIVKLLMAEGAVTVGKNNLHEYAFGITSTNPHYGAVKNPWNTEYIPGGSSGGSGAAIAANTSLVSIGTDTGGSIRVPAAACGVVGLKPTNGLLSTSGVTGLSWTLDNVGPLAANMEDLSIVMEALTNVPYTQECTNDIRGLRIGVPTSFFNENVDEESYRIFEQAITKLEDLGAIIIDIDIPNLEGYHEIGFVIAMSEANFLHKENIENSIELYGDDVKEIMKSTQGISTYDYLNALHIKENYKKAFEKVFTKVDVLATLTMPAPPQKIGEKEVKFGSKTEDIFACLTRFASIFNIIELPALSIPCGITAKQLPVGLQLVSKKYQENILIKAGYAFEQNYLSDFYNKRDEICLELV